MTNDGDTTMLKKGFAALLGLLVCVACIFAEDANKKDDEGWKPLFDGKTLEGWKSTKFGGEGEVEVKDGMIVLNTGSDMTGITYTGKLPKSNYELLIEAQRLDGFDFFAGVTFPVGDGFASFIPGGWGGGVTGISNINGRDASENETTQPFIYKAKTWYKFRIQVTDDKLAVWIDDKKKVDVDRTDKIFSLRNEVDLSKPLGIATWSTKGAVRTIKLRELPEKKK
jgi:hypothetical protein